MPEIKTMQDQDYSSHRLLRQLSQVWDGRQFAKFARPAFPRVRQDIVHELPRVLKLQPAGSSYTPLKNSTAFAANVDTNTLRSRNRLPFSQEVSGAKRHAWQQAPCT